MSLVVEDDAVFRRLIVKALTRNNFAVVEAENGIKAQRIFDEQHSDLDIIISDVKMPELDGVEFLKYVRSQSDIPFILMTGFSEIVEAQGAARLGANEFLQKPFRTDDMIEAVEACLHKADSSSNMNLRSEKTFLAIRIEDFVSSSKLQSNIYLKLASDKFIKIANKGDYIPVDRIRFYKEKNIDFLYIIAPDRSTFDPS